MGNLALTFRNQGRAAEAEALHRQEYEMKTRVLGPEHPHTLLSMHNLALAIDSRGNKGDAWALMVRCFELQCQTIGYHHPHTVIALETLNRWREEISHQGYPS
jgi:hypothetical protein